MNGRDVQQVKDALLACVAPAMAARGYALDNVPDDFDLRAHGVVDSLGFMQLVSDLEARLGHSIDLADLDPECLTHVGVLSCYIVAQLAAHDPVR